jgi:hypothetical protein
VGGVEKPLAAAARPAQNVPDAAAVQAAVLAARARAAQEESLLPQMIAIGVGVVFVLGVVGWLVMR